MGKARRNEFRRRSRRAAVRRAGYSLAKAGYRQRRRGCLNSGAGGRFGNRRFRVWEVIPMNSKAYSARDVNQVCVERQIEGRAGQAVWAGVDVGKYEVRVVPHWGQGDF